MSTPQHGGPAGIGFSGGFTRTGKMIAAYYATVFVAGLVATNWLAIGVVGELILNPLGSGRFGLWQLVTHIGVYPGAVFEFLLNMFMLWLFGWQVESRVGRAQFLFLVFGIPLVAGGIGIFATQLEPFSAPLWGFSLVIDVLIVAYVMLHRHAVINLMFVFPMRAVHLIWLVVAIQGLMFLARTNPWLHYQLISMGLTYLCFRFDLRWDPGLWRLRRKRGHLIRMQDHLKSVKEKEKEDDDGPLYH